jgi:hypothetical protein
MTITWGHKEALDSNFESSSSIKSVIKEHKVMPEKPDVRKIIYCK